MRFYGFDVTELAASASGMLDLDMDPKLAWALLNRDRFPLDINRASREELLRVPGLGVKAVERILKARRHGSLGMADLGRLRVPMTKVAPFVIIPDHRPRNLDGPGLAASLVRLPVQGTLFT
jgi:predicted DNA-binding helix-hairpin-helix protein